MIRASLVLLLGAVFVMAGVAKLRDGGAFVAVLRKLTPAVSGLLAWFIPVGELVLGVFLFSGFFVRVTAAVAFAVLWLFTVALLRMHKLHVGGCGCFGEKADGDSIAFGVARNVLLIAAAAWVAARPVKPWAFHFRDVLGMITVVVGLCCAWSLLLGLFQSRGATNAILRARSS
jgi:uncharacterized membrane protein YphA (DoxX/SURF4 family)